MSSALIFFDCAFEYFAPTTAVRMEKSARANLVASSTSINFSPTCDAREALSQIRGQERRYGDGAQPNYPHQCPTAPTVGRRFLCNFAQRSWFARSSRVGWSPPFSSVMAAVVKSQAPYVARK